MEFPEFKIIPGGELLDRVVSAGLWLGKLITRRHLNSTPSEHFKTPEIGVIKPEPYISDYWDPKEDKIIKMVMGLRDDLRGN